MGMYCACGIKKSANWKCECDWKGWNLCYEMSHNDGHFPENLPIKECPDIDGIYQVRTFDDDYDETESEFSTIKKNWGESTNQIISNWKVEYSDGWTGYRGVYAWKEKEF